MPDRIRPQPHVHPQPGPLDARGNCPDCAVYDPAAPVHQCPPNGSGIMPCCGLSPLERIADRMTLDPRSVTCPATPEPVEGEPK